MALTVEEDTERGDVPTSKGRISVVDLDMRGGRAYWTVWNLR